MKYVWRILFMLHALLSLVIFFMLEFDVLPIEQIFLLALVYGASTVYICSMDLKYNLLNGE